MTLDLSNQRVGIGTTSPSSLLEVSKSSNSSDIRASAWSTTDAHSGTITFVKSASATQGTYAATADGEQLGAIQAYGSESGNGISAGAGAIVFSQDGAAASGRIPSRITFYTGSGTANQDERMRIDQEGKVGIGTTAPETSLHVGSTATGSIGATGRPLIVSSTLATTYDGTSSASWQGIKTNNADATSNRTATGISFEHRTSSSGIAAIV